MLFVGIDSVEINRIEKAMKNPRFCQRVFGEAENSLLAMRGFSAESAAACFCAKEAFSKAMGTGIRGFRLSEVELLRNDVGAPFLQLSGNALKIAREKGTAVFRKRDTYTGTSYCDRYSGEGGGIRMKVFSASQSRELEERAVASGISYSELMENAGAAAVRFLMKKYSIKGKRLSSSVEKEITEGTAL